MVAVMTAADAQPAVLEDLGSVQTEARWVSEGAEQTW